VFRVSLIEKFCGDLWIGFRKGITLVVVVDFLACTGGTASSFLPPLLQSAPAGHSCLPSVQAFSSEHIRLTDEFRPILRSWMDFAGFLIIQGVPICSYHGATIFHIFITTHIEFYFAAYYKCQHYLLLK
jgi:hypothetical protein